MRFHFAALASLVLVARVEGFAPSILSPSLQRQKVSIFSQYEIQKQKQNGHLLDTSLPASVASSEKTENGLFGHSSIEKPLGKIAATLSKIGLMTFIVSMCLALPVALFPPFFLRKIGVLGRVQQEIMSLRAGQFCARWLVRLIPFCKLTTIPHFDNDPQPCVWVCNHTSALDIFILLAADKKLRGRRKRPIKIVYWKGLESNPITKLLFTQCGFISVQMAANKAGEANDYDLKSFKKLLKDAKQAFKDGFDIGILPEGQLNPHPEEGLLPCFSGAYTLAKMSRRPVHMMALHGTHRLWHAREDIGMTVTGRNIKVRAYPGGRKFESGDEFLAAFEAVVGEFATKGQDLDDDEIAAWMDGSKWKKLTAAKSDTDSIETKVD